MTGEAPCLRMKSLWFGRPTGRPNMKPPGRGSRARAKSALRGLTCGYGAQRPRWSLLSRRCAPHLHGEQLTQAQVGATWRSVSGCDGPESAPDHSLSTPASEQVKRLHDDFARALGVARPSKL